MRSLQCFMVALILMLIVFPQMAAAGPFDSGGALLGTLLIALLVLVLVFFIAREILCWYWKINTIVSLLEDIKGKLINLNPSISAQNLQPTPINSSDSPSNAHKVKCKKCGEKTSSEAKFCEFCGAAMTS